MASPWLSPPLKMSLTRLDSSAVPIASQQLATGEVVPAHAVQ
eukprot:COSAG06_NODE_28474_length_573_cov_1.871308_1_plen_41_part_01